MTRLISEIWIGLRHRLSAFLILLSLLLLTTIILFRSGAVGVSSPDHLRRLLELAVTVSGVAGGSLFGFVSLAWFHVWRQADGITTELRRMQCRLERFSNLCHSVTRSDQLWRKIFALTPDTVESAEQEHALHFWNKIQEYIDAIRRQDNSNYGSAPLLSSDQLSKAERAASGIWYSGVGDSSSKYVRNFLVESNGVERVADDLLLVDTDRHEFGLEGELNLTAFSEVAGQIEILIQEMHVNQVSLSELSPRNSLQKFRWLGLFLLFGFAFPFMALVFEIDEPVFVFAAYFILIVFITVAAVLTFELTSLLKSDFYELFVVRRKTHPLDM